MRSVKYHLVARVSVNGGHDARNDGISLVEGVRHGSEAVGGAGSRGDDGVFLGERLFVYAEYDGGKVIARGSGDDDFLRAGVDMRLRLCLGRVEARAFEHDVYADFAPGKVRRVFFGIDFNRLAADGDGTRLVVRRNGVRVFVSALRGIVFQQVRQHLGAGEVVDRNDFVTLCAEHLTESKAPDASESVDRYSYVCHD